MEVENSYMWLMCSIYYEDFCGYKNESQDLVYAKQVPNISHIPASVPFQNNPPASILSQWHLMILT